jgi:hypothetical protein
MYRFSPFPNEVTVMNTFYLRNVAPAVVATLCFFATVAGCQSHEIEQRAEDPASVEIPESGSSGAVQRTSTSSGNAGATLTTAVLSDASYGGMQATEVTAPGGWRVQGQVISSPCAYLPSATWDAVAPNGQGEMHVLPIFGWRWGQSRQGNNGCIPLNGPVQAADFLQKFAARVPGVHVLGTMLIADAFRRREENFTRGADNNNARLLPALQARNTGDVAAIQAIDSSGHEMRLRAWVECRQRAQGGDCFARVDILRAPKGRLNALVTLVDSHNMVQDRPTQQWQAAFLNHQQQVGAQQMEQLRRNADAGNQALAQQRRNAAASSQMLHQQYLDSSARLNAEHQAGMEQIQRSTDSSMRNANNSMNARTTAASDMQDYSLDRQTVSGANGTYKTSSQYSNVWSSPVGPALSDGRTFGSTDNTVDPNTATDNTWTKDTKVHGNGQPY